MDRHTNSIVVTNKRQRSEIGGDDLLLEYESDRKSKKQKPEPSSEEHFCLFPLDHLPDDIWSELFSYFSGKKYIFTDHIYYAKLSLINKKMLHKVRYSPGMHIHCIFYSRIHSINFSFIKNLKHLHMTTGGGIFVGESDGLFNFSEEQMNGILSISNLYHLKLAEPGYTPRGNMQNYFTPSLKRILTSEAIKINTLSLSYNFFRLNQQDLIELSTKSTILRSLKKLKILTITRYSPGSIGSNPAFLILNNPDYWKLKVDRVHITATGENIDYIDIPKIIQPNSVYSNIKKLFFDGIFDKHIQPDVVDAVKSLPRDLEELRFWYTEKNLRDINYEMLKELPKSIKSLYIDDVYFAGGANIWDTLPEGLEVLTIISVKTETKKSIQFKYTRFAVSETFFRRYTNLKKLHIFSHMITKIFNFADISYYNKNGGQLQELIMHHGNHDAYTEMDMMYNNIKRILMYRISKQTCLHYIVRECLKKTHKDKLNYMEFAQHIMYGKIIMYPEGDWFTEANWNDPNECWFDKLHRKAAGYEKVRGIRNKLNM